VETVVYLDDSGSMSAGNNLREAHKAFEDLSKTLLLNQGRDGEDVRVEKILEEEGSVGVGRRLGSGGDGSGEGVQKLSASSGRTASNGNGNALSTSSSALSAANSSSALSTDLNSKPLPITSAPSDTTPPAHNIRIVTFGSPHNSKVIVPRGDPWSVGAVKYAWAGDSGGTYMWKMIHDDVNERYAAKGSSEAEEVMEKVKSGSWLGRLLGGGSGGSGSDAVSTYNGGSGNDVDANKPKGRLRIVVITDGMDTHSPGEWAGVKGEDEILGPCGESDQILVGLY
jgi:hypothetical protein